MSDLKIGTGGPFHAGERAVQQRLGHAERMAAIGPRVIRDQMPQQHQAFFQHQQMLILGSVGEAGDPWVSFAVGTPGFAHAPDARHLRVDALPVGGAPGLSFVPAQRIGMLGIDYSNRRRNRVNGRIDDVDDTGFMLAVEQSFGNCPKYIQTRASRAAPRGEGAAAALRVEPGDEALQRLVEGADHFYIASHHFGHGRGHSSSHSSSQSSEHSDDARDGADVSHRGGRPGFVRIDADGTLAFPDFAGNRFYNTLGNIESNGRAGLAFIDFEDGSVVTMSGDAAVDYRADAARRFAGAERLVHFAPAAIWRHPRLLPFRWSLLECSPALAGTGSWNVA